MIYKRKKQEAENFSHFGTSKIERWGKDNGKGFFWVG
jgi:hypothetical protein